MPITAPLDLTTIENAIHNWFSTATGLTTIWSNQSGMQPPKPFATLEIISGPTPLSPFWESRNTYSVARPLGEEIELNTCVPGTMTVSCQVIVGQPAANVPTTNARAYVLAALADLGKESVWRLLADADIAIERTEAVQNLPVLSGAEIDSRAGMDVLFGVALNAIDYVGYINKVGLKSPALGIDIIIDDT